MTSVQPSDSGVVKLPASMQTLLDRCTEREITSQELQILAQACPNVRCEALRILFQLNDAAAAVDYVLAHGVAAATPRSHAGTSRGHRSSHSTSSSSAAAAVTTAAAATAATSNAAVAASAAAPKSALQALCTNAFYGKPAAVQRPKHDVTEPRDSAEADNWRSTVAVVGFAGSPAPPSPLAKATSRSRRAAATRGESVCTLVTVSSMSSSSSDDDCDYDDRNSGDAMAEVAKEGADMPPTVTLRTRTTHPSTSSPASPAPDALALAVEGVPKQRNNSGSCSKNSPNVTYRASGAAPTAGARTATAAVVEVRTSVSPAMSIATTNGACPGRDRAVSPTVMPPPGARRLPSPTVEVPVRLSAKMQRAKKSSPPTPTASTAAAVAPPASPVPAPLCDTAKSEAPAGAMARLSAVDDMAEEAPRKTVAAKPARLYIDATLHTNATTGDTPAGAAAAATTHHVGFADATAMEVLGAYRRLATAAAAAAAAAAAGESGEVELAYTELSGRHSSPSPSCAPPSCGVRTDWAALVAAARPPPTLPAHEVLAAADGGDISVFGGAGRQSDGLAAAEPASAVSSPLTARRTASTKTPTTPPPAKSALKTATTPRPTPASGPGSPRTSSAKPPRTPRPSDAAKPPMAASSIKRDKSVATAAAPTPARLPLRTPRVSFEDGSARKTGTGSPSHMSPRGSHRSSTGGRGASPEKRGVAWDEATKTYITHPNQLLRQMSRGALLADAPASTSADAADAPVEAPAKQAAAVQHVTVCAAGASALAAPSSLRYFFSRTASNSASGPAATAEGEKARGQPALARKSAAAAASLGRLCSSVAHLSVSNKAATPAERKTTSKSSSHGLCAKAEPASRRDTVLNTPRSARAVVGASKKLSAGHTLTPPPAMMPIKPSPRVLEYQRLRSGFAVPAGNVYCHGGEVIALQRQASHMHALQQATATSPDTSPNKLHRTATGAGSGARLERHYSMMHGGGVEVVDVEVASPLRLRTPRTARQPAVSRLSLPCHDTSDASRTSARRRNGAPGECVAEEQGPVPAAQCSVFERLASNYYTVYSSATALQPATSSPPPVTARPRTARKEQQSAGRHRNVSSPPTCTRGRRGPLQRTAAAAAPTFRDAWLNPREMDEEAEVDAGQQHGKAPAPSAFVRSNTSRYLAF